MRTDREAAAAQKAAPKSNISRRRQTARADGSEYYHERREALKRAAATLFRQHALKDVSLDDIAKLAGVDRSSIYYYVSGKKELFFEVVREAMAGVVKRVEDIAAAEAKPQEKIRLLMIAIMEHYATNHPYMFLFLREHLSETDVREVPQLHELTALAKRVDDAVAGIIRAGIKAKVVRSDLTVNLISYGMLGMVNWSHRWFNPAGRLSGQDVGREFAEIVLNGVRQPEASASDSVLEAENQRLHRLVSTLSLEIQSLRDQLAERP
jgi:AcrR family transcriptional regulator